MLVNARSIALCIVALLLLLAGCGGKTGLVPAPDFVPPQADAGFDASDAAADAGLCASAADCDDGDACTLDACVRGRCESTSLSCEDAIVCTVDLCTDTGCSHRPDHALCGPLELCDPELGCVQIPCDDPLDCEDGVFCNGIESCVVALCVRGPTPVCDDGVDCTEDVCDVATDGCTARPNDTRCEDGIFCNGPPRCEVSSGCVTGPGPDCADELSCTTDTCDGTLDECVHEPPDRDADGYADAACLGDDCDDTDARVHPDMPEICDGRDQNCSGGIDEGVLSECGDCRECFIRDLPNEQPWDDDPGRSSGVHVGPDGGLVLDGESQEIYFAWIANTDEGTISKLDTRTGGEVGRYPAVTTATPNGGEPPFNPCDDGFGGFGGTGNCPSRTAVDLRGDVYVANRAFLTQGTVTKIANFTEDCLDRDGDGVIETSSDLNGNGTIDLGDPTEYRGLADECVLWTVDAGEPDSVPRAIAIDAEGHVWVGLFNVAAFLELDPNDGSLLDEVFVDVAPYGAAIGSDGVLWAADACCGQGGIQPIDTATGEVGERVAVQSTVGCIGNYGIAIDGDDRVWLGGFPCEAAFRYNPASDSWLSVNLPGRGLGRGIAAGADGRIWMGISTSASYEQIGRVVSFRAADGGGVRSYDLPRGVGTVGVGLDSANNVWAVNRDTSTASRIDPATGDIDEFPVGRGPYTYSDFTGFALRTFTSPSGYHREVVNGCDNGPTVWEEVWWDAEVPAGTRIELSVRTAASLADLPSQSFIGPWAASPAELADPPGPVESNRYLELEVRLYSEGQSTPQLDGLHVQASCP